MGNTKKEDERGRRRRTDALLDFLAAFLADFVRFPIVIIISRYYTCGLLRGRFVTLLFTPPHSSSLFLAIKGFEI